MMLMRLSLHKLPMVAISLLLSSCSNFSSGNLFSHYSAQQSDAYNDVKSGQYQSAEQALFDAKIGGEILDNMERGRVSFLAGNYPQSFSALQASDEAVKKQDGRATISASESANSVGTLTTNDNLTEYEPADYELGYLHLYLSLNYIKQNNLSDALVEIRRANQVQESAKKKRNDDFKKVQQESEERGVSTNTRNVMSHYSAISDQLQAVQNAYLFYLSGLFYETGNQPNDAYIDYKRALEVYPDNKQIINATMRLATRLGMREDLAQFNTRYGQLEPIPQGYGEVIVIDERGVVEARDKWSLSIPIFSHSTGKSRLYNVSLPTYRQSTFPDQSGHLQLDGQSIPSYLLADNNLMAAKDLKERIPTMVLRQSLRIVVKEQLRQQASKQDDSGFTNILVNIWNYATEQPDTRSWITLPSQVYSSNSVLTAGDHTLTINGEKFPFKVKENRQTLVWLSRQGNSVSIWYKYIGDV